MGPAETLPSSLTRGRIAAWLALSLLVLAILIHLVLPFWALRWAHIPFPGFVVEQTLVVNDAHGADWPDKNAPAPFSRIRAVDGQSVDTVAAFLEQLQNHAAGDEVEFSWETQGSSTLTTARVQLGEFPRQDLVMMFWLPYLIGILFLGGGLGAGLSPKSPTCRPLAHSALAPDYPRANSCFVERTHPL